MNNEHNVRNPRLGKLMTFLNSDDLINQIVLSELRVKS